MSWCRRFGVRFKFLELDRLVLKYCTPLPPYLDGLPWIAMGCHGIMFPLICHLSRNGPEKPSTASKRLLQRRLFFYICLCSFFRMFLACLSLVYHVFYRVTLSFAMILSLETQLYTPLFLLINPLLTSAFARRKLEDLQSRQ